METREFVLMIVFASLYAAATIVLAPISFGPIQLRLADCLIPLAALFGWPVMVGVTLGCFVGNIYFFLGLQDIILGPVANLIASTIIFRMRRKPLLGSILGSLKHRNIYKKYYTLVQTNNFSCFDYSLEII